MLAPTAAGLDEDKAGGAFDVLVVEGAALTVLYSEIIRGAIDEFKRGKDLGQLTLDRLVERLDVIKVG